MRICADAPEYVAQIFKGINAQTFVCVMRLRFPIKVQLMPIDNVLGGASQI
jgi:hypothetical protein